MQKLHRIGLVTAALALTAGQVRADTTFAAGSLIIPATSNYQDDCGAVAMYGLVYQILRANPWLQAKGYGQIEVYYAYNTAKTSPNRCTPTNLDKGPSYLASSFSGTGSWAAVPSPTSTDAKWTDGCDFHVPLVTDASVPPVKLVTYGAEDTVASDSAVVTKSGYTTTSATGTTKLTKAGSVMTLTLASSLFASSDIGNKVTIAGGSAANNGTYTITGYSTSKVVTFTNATGTLQTFTGTVTLARPRTNVYPAYSTQTIAAGTVTEVRYGGGSFIIDSTDAMTLRKLLKGTYIANDKADGTGNNISFASVRNTASCSFGSTAGGFVNIHSAQRSFQAPTPKVFTATPPRLALLARNANQSPSAGGSSATAGSNSYTKRVDDNILQKYLTNAGLSFSGARGCPSDGYDKNDSTICPVGSGFGGVSGQIYDLVDFRDLYSGVLTSVTGRYQMLWAPHWESNGTKSTNEASALANVSSFLNGTGGLMAECASIESFEGVSGSTASLANTQFQTCHATGANCDATVTNYGITKNSSNTPDVIVRNCTDPNLADGNNCAFFSNPGDSFSQTADFNWDPGSSGSHIHDWLNNSGATRIYRPSVLPLVSGVKSNVQSKGISATAARGMINGDYATRGNKDDDSAKGNVLYIGGHDLSDSVAGTKVILQTLLQLGEPVAPTITTEVTRSSPVVATISSAPAVVQGSFESIQPAPAGTTISNGGSVTDSFQFPAVLGHLRAVAVSNVGTATSFNGLTAIFDAATNIPANNDTCTAFTSTCRTVFTNLSSGANPTRTLVTTANVSTVGPAMAGDLTTANQTKLIQRTLAGIGSGSTWTSKLGGVDRSTAAVIESSLVAGATRPTVAYFGGTDGMLHAVCASTVGTQCTTLGTEMWAFLPRTQLPLVRSNATRIDGSPRVVDMFGDFTASGSRGFRTILLFQTGSGDPTVSTASTATYALDVTDPSNPQILWEYDTAGKGLTIMAGKVLSAGALRLAAFVQTNNGDTVAGSVLHAINIETGADLWSRVQFVYPNPPRTSGTPVPTSGIPGGAVAVDKVGAGFLTDIVYGTLYGDMWQLDASTGVNRHGADPLFRFTTNYHPFGAPPAIYADGGKFLAVAVPGGYADTQAASAQWTTSSQTAVAVSLSSLTGNLTESSGTPDVPWTYPLTNEKGFGQVLVVGNQIFFTTDSSDVNNSAFGTTATQTGKAYRFDINGTSPTVAVIQGGTGSLVTNGSQVMAGGADKMESISSLTATAGGTSVATSQNQATRRLWLQTL